MMHVLSADPAAFAQQWEGDIGAVITAQPIAYAVGDTIKYMEATSGVATGRYVLATVTRIVPLSDAFATVYQTIFQRAVQ